MIDIMLLISFATLIVLIFFAYKGVQRKQKNDSALRQRAIFNASEQLVFSRLKVVFPEANILAHVSFDALLTTKYSHTRRKYQKMFADFVILNQNYQVIAIVALDDGNLVKRSGSAMYQDALLEMANYRVIRYAAVPDYQQLREDFLLEFAEPFSMDAAPLAPTDKLAVYHRRISGSSVFG